eukprot:CAMPEP_0174376956 /NCGR_PEP_ID=MMETSP0811_2-20130205/120187_1 /TAXON_ID=73025 ORGANISM="Eutreptiella gymnastica-like, Strain CCMP1594" /NCGR_SAMPLE_ID=MMETSP0811_2 /ASSEMBLY_ACC=CAM_ASM_000667 /LENGTH=118 /DNA_ID=CAMNT_0015528707 /DNA_START=1099 /DNA_END=1455 /DNA_ORIENTATION=-
MSRGLAVIAHDEPGEAQQEDRPRLIEGPPTAVRWPQCTSAGYCASVSGIHTHTSGQSSPLFATVAFDVQIRVAPEQPKFMNFIEFVSSSLDTLAPSVATQDCCNTGRLRKSKAHVRHM